LKREARGRQIARQPASGVVDPETYERNILKGIIMPTARQKDACDLLDADHKAVKKMFSEFEALT
jgi:hypothetical protein